MPSIEGATAIVCCPALTAQSHRPTTARVAMECVVRAGQCVMLRDSKYEYVAMALHIGTYARWPSLRFDLIYKPVPFPGP